MNIKEFAPYAGRGLAKQALGMASMAGAAALIGAEGMAAWASAYAIVGAVASLLRGVVATGGTLAAEEEAPASVGGGYDRALMVALVAAVLVAIGAGGLLAGLAGDGLVAQIAIGLAGAEVMGILAVGCREVLNAQGRGVAAVKGLAAGDAADFLGVILGAAMFGPVGVTLGVVIAEVARLGSALLPLLDGDWRPQPLSALPWRQADGWVPWRRAVTLGVADGAMGALSSAVYAVVLEGLVASSGDAASAANSMLIKASGIYYRAFGPAAGAIACLLVQARQTPAELTRTVRQATATFVLWSGVCMVYLWAMPEAGWVWLLGGEVPAAFWGGLDILIWLLVPLSALEGIGAACVRATNSARFTALASGAPVLQGVVALALLRWAGLGLDAVWYGFVADTVFAVLVGLAAYRKLLRG